MSLEDKHKPEGTDYVPAVDDVQQSSSLADSLTGDLKAQEMQAKMQAAMEQAEQAKNKPLPLEHFFPRLKDVPLEVLLARKYGNLGPCFISDEQVPSCTDAANIHEQNEDAFSLKPASFNPSKQLPQLFPEEILEHLKNSQSKADNSSGVMAEFPLKNDDITYGKPSDTVTPWPPSIPAALAKKYLRFDRDESGESIADVTDRLRAWHELQKWNTGHDGVLVSATSVIGTHYEKGEAHPIIFEGEADLIEYTYSVNGKEHPMIFDGKAELPELRYYPNTLLSEDTDQEGKQQ